MPQQIEDLQKDDKFMALSPEAKAIVLGKKDPNFAKLSKEAQQIVIGKLRKPDNTDTFMYGLKSQFPSAGEVSKFGRNLVNPKTTTKTIDTLVENLATQSKGEYEKGKEAFKEGRYAEGSGRIAASAIPFFGPAAAESGEDIGSGHVKRGLGKATGIGLQLFGPEIVKGASKAVAPVVRAGARAAGIAPEFEVIEGVKIPRLASEARPTSVGGRVVKTAKRLGMNEKGFSEFADKQNQAVKEVIKNVAEKTAKQKLPNLLDNPADALNKASDAVEAESRAMYKALDSTVDQIPGGGQVLVKGLTPVVRKFLEKFPVTQASLPGGDVLVDARGIASRLINEAETATTPFQTAQDLRSALYKAARKATDANTRRLILEGVEEVDTGMENALNRSGSPALTKLWRDANKGWSKKYALNEVADAVNRAIKGSPAEISDVAPKIAAKPLANMLNDLSNRNGRGLSVMEKAFGSDFQGHAHIGAIRRAVALLEQAQKTKVGGGFGKARLAIHGTAAATGLITGHFGYAGSAMAFELGGEQLAKAMTSLKGARTVEKLLQANTVSEATRLRDEVQAEAQKGHVEKPFPKSNLRPPTAPQGGHAGGGVTSVEELNRQGTNYVVSKTGGVSYHGKQFDPGGIQTGATHVTVMPDGSFRINGGQKLTPVQENALRRAIKK